MSEFGEGDLRENKLRRFVHSRKNPVSTILLSCESVSPEEKQREDAGLRGVEGESLSSGR